MTVIKNVLNIFITNKELFLKLTLEHLKICGLSIFLATIIGLSFGIFISRYKKTANLVLGTTNIIYTIPAISLLGFLIPLTGIGNFTAIIALTVYALLPMIRNTYTGIIGVDADVLESAKGMGSTSFQLMTKIKLPLAMPIILSGIKNMVVMTIALAGVASFVGAGGLGVAIYRGITTNNMPMTIAGSLLIAIIAFIADFFLTLLEKSFQIGTNKKNKYKYIFIFFIAIILIVVSFISLPKKNTTIQIASKPMTEQLILTEMLSLLIEDNTNLNVNITKGVGGGTSNIQPALLKGDFDMYPEYTGTGWSFVLKKDTIPDDKTLQIELEKEYKEKYNLDWVGMYGFNNTYGLAVKKSIATKYNLKTYSDLEKISNTLTFGGEYDFFQRDDGYDSLCRAYNFKFKKQIDMDIGLKYNAINNNQIDVMNIFTTDGQLSVSDITVLEDDKNFYENYYCGTVVRDDILKKYPQLKKPLMLMDNILSEPEMAHLNYLVEGEHLNEKDVAKEFLISKNLLKK